MGIVPCEKPTDVGVEGREPSAADLAVLVAGEPLTAAEVALVDAECGLVAAVDSWMVAFRHLAWMRRTLGVVR